MKIVIDTKEIERLNVSCDLVLYALSLYLNSNITQHTINNAHDLGLTKKFSILSEGKDYELDSKGTKLIEEIILNGELGGNANKEGRFERLAREMRELFPTGKKPGTNYMWRDSVTIIATRLKALVKKTNAKFTDEEVIEATKKYVNSFNGNYTYMQLLKYFISKQVVIGGQVEESSQLLSFIENKDEDINQDWTTEVR